MPTSSATPASSSINETKILMSDPTALGVFGLSMVTFVAASQKMGWTTGSAYVIPWALFLGSIAQVWASSIDFRKNNYFGAIVLGAYGLFWIAVTMHWAISLGWLGAVGDKADPRQLGVACIGYFIFSLFIMVAAFEANKVFAAILVMINVLLPSLALSIFGINAPFFSKLAAYSELAIALLGFYCAGAVFLNSYFGRTLLPLGKPFGFIRKGSLAIAAREVPVLGPAPGAPKKIGALAAA
jgi:succinate-acetate transporter protein